MDEPERGTQDEPAGVQVTRRRRQRIRRGVHTRRALVAATVTGCLLAAAGASYATTQVFHHRSVGTVYPNGLQISDDQVIKPLGERLVTKTGKFMGSTVSPDGRYLAATSTDRDVALQIFDLKTYKEIWTVGTSESKETFKDGTVGQEGPTYSPDGKTLWVGQQDEITKFPVKADGTLGTPVSYKIPQKGKHPTGNAATLTPDSALVGQIAYAPDGSTIYAAVNGQNSVIAMNPNTGKILRTWAVGIAPRSLMFVGDRLYVSNEGGHRARPGEKTMDSYGTAVPANGYLGTSDSGTVSVIDTARPSARVASINVGLHPTALFFAPRRGQAHAAQPTGTLFVANTNSDTVSAIDTRTDTVRQTIQTDPWPSSTVGYEPTGIAMGAGGHLLVTLGRANAVAVYRYHGGAQQPVNYIGLLPTDYYPSDVATVGHEIYVTNTRGIDARGPAITTDKGAPTPTVSGHNTHSTTGSLTRFELPPDRDIAKTYTPTVFAQNGWTKHDVVEAKTHTDAKPVAIPTRIGDPSTIKHVFLIVKENRGYDQFFGDIKKGNGDPKLVQFGQKVTPNQHKLANQFGLYDNFYDIGTNSAEGHNWLMQGDNPEYTESSAGEYQRSYDTEEDVLGHQRSGFLWTAIESAGKTARDYGEYEYMEGKPSGTWQQYYCAARSVEAGGNPAQLTTKDLKGDYGSVIPSLNAISDRLSPPFDLTIPDIYREQIWKQNFERKGPADFNMIWFSSDHTGGPADSEAGVADNDLATGQMVDAITHSRYWKNSAIFVVEDDSQDAADHVDGHRAPVQIISPYAQHDKVDNTYYTQLTLVRTIEQILGAQPLNEKLAAATPMYGAFTNHPNDATFTAVPNQVPLTENIKTAPACGLDKTGVSDAGTDRVNARQQVIIPARMAHTAAVWKRWASHQRLAGDGAVPDYADPEQMNRYVWYQDHNWTTPYPGDTRVYLPSQVPGGFIPSSDPN